MPTNLTFQGTPSFATGKFGQALNVNGNNSVGLAGKVPASGPFTVECWFRGTGVGIPIGQIDAIFIQVEGGGNLKAVYGSGTTLNAGVVVNDDAWHHVALVITDAGGSLYLDGQRRATSTVTPTAAGMNRTNNGLYIGAFGPSTFVYTGLIDEAAIFTTERYTGATYTVPTAAYAGNVAGIDRLYHLDGDGVDSAGAATPTPGVTIAANDPAILYSPANWVVTAGGARTINAGAYGKVAVATAGPIILTFDVSQVTGAKPRISYRIDGQPGFTTVDLAAAIQIDVPAGVANQPRHTVEWVVDAMPASGSRWGTPASVAVIFTGLQLPANATVVAPTRRARTVWFFGDSITEGTLAGLRDGSSEPAQNSALGGWALALGDALGAEVGIMGCGNQGYTRGGNGGVPALPDSYSLVYAGQARSFSPAPDLIIDNMVTNDGGASQADRRAAVQLFITRLLASLGSSATTRVVLLGALSTAYDADRQAAVTAVGDPRVTFETTAGVYDTAFTGGELHPSAAANRAQVVPRLVAKLLPYAQPRRFTVTLA